MRAVRPVHLVLSLVLALFVGPLVLGVGPASAESFPRVIDTFDSASGDGVGFGTRTVTKSPSSSKADFGGGSVKVTVPAENNGPNVTFTYTSSTPIRLTQGGATQVRISYSSIDSSPTKPSAVILGLQGTDDTGGTCGVSTGIGNSSSPGYVTFAFGQTSTDFGRGCNLEAMRTLKLVVTPSDNTGGTSSVDLADLSTVNPNGTPGQTTQSQMITFITPRSPIVVGDSSSLVATASSGKKVTFSILSPSVCHLDAAGTAAVADHTGFCTVAADQAGDADYDPAPQVSRTITINKADQTITFDKPTSPVAIGSSTPLSATASSKADVTFTSLTTGVCRVVSGKAVADHAGTCTIAADQAGTADYQAATRVTRDITVDKTAQAVGFTSQAPSPAYVGATYTVSATGGAGTAPVTFSSTTPTTCSVAGAVVRFLAAGTCTVRADQASDADHSAAPPATQTITVTRVPATVTVSLDPTTTVYGQRVTATAVVSPASGSAGGTVQFSVDGTPVGTPVTVVNGRATSADLAPLAVGSRAVSAAYTPTDAITYAPATGSATLAVTKAATTTTVRVEPATLVAAVAPVAPGAGTPSGTVDFRVDGTVVGTATLVNGTARLTYTVPAGATRAVAAAYAGDARFTASSASTARQDPTITAALTSPSTRSANGWYAGPVTVTFTCTTPGAALTSPCPTPVVLDRDGAGQSVSRTITTTDGGAATAVVSGINVDTVAPRVKLTGLRRGAQHVATTPKAPRCKATDSLSGVLICTVEKRTTKTADGTRVRYRAVATDLAGNTASSTRGTKVATLGLDGVDVVRGVYQTRAGSSYTLVALGTAPRYRYAAPAPGAPHGGDVAMTRAGTVNGKPRWTIGIAITPAMRSHRYWNLGIVQDGKLRTIRIRVS